MNENHLGSLDFSRLLKPGDTICWGQGPAEPVALTAELMKQRHSLGRLQCFIGMGWSDTPNPEYSDVVCFTSYCAAGTNRRLMEQGQLDILPLNYSTISRRLPEIVDVLFIQVAPTKRKGRFSFSLACEYLQPLLRSARVVVAEVNELAPVTRCEFEISSDDLDHIVWTSRDLPKPREIRIGDLERRIAENVAGLVEDGAVLQVGLGALPECVLSALSGHRNLGIHSGMISDSVVDLYESGAIGGQPWNPYTGNIVTGLLAGGDRLNEFAQKNDGVILRSTAYTHDPNILAGIDHLVAINSAVEVDLSGQVNAETAGGKYVGAVGGLSDFITGAHRSMGGLPVIVMPSTAKGPNGSISRIVPRVNGPVTLGASLAGIIVTEYGVADLRALTLRQRHRKMIEIAHPDFRESLERQTLT